MYNSPLPHDEATEYAEFQVAFASAMRKAAQPVCTPPAVKTDFAEGLAAPVDSEQAGGIPEPICLTCGSESLLSICAVCDARYPALIQALGL